MSCDSNKTYISTYGDLNVKIRVFMICVARFLSARRDTLKQFRTFKLRRSGYWVEGWGLASLWALSHHGPLEIAIGKIKKCAQPAIPPISDVLSQKLAHESQNKKS